MKHVSPENLPQVLPPDAEPWRVRLMLAADHMEQYGWCAGYSPGKAACAVNSVAWAASPNSARLPTLDDIGVDALCRLSDYIGGSSIPPWSDSSDQQTVVSTMRACALRG